MKTIWITGASGYIAYFLMEYLRNEVKEDLEIVAIGRTRPKFKPDVFFSIDLTKPDCIDEFLNIPKPHAVFHLAGVIPPASPQDMWSVNVGGTVYLLRALEKLKKNGQPITLINVGSAAEYSSFHKLPVTEEAPVGGTGVYGMSKWSQSEMALIKGLRSSIRVIVARPFNIIGPFQSTRYIAGTICSQILDPKVKEISLGNLEVKRDFVDVRDVARALCKLWQKGEANECYNICSGKSISVLKLYELFIRVSGSSKPLVSTPQRMRPGEWMDIYGSFDKLNRTTGWSPEISLEQSVRDMLHYAVSHEK